MKWSANTDTVFSKISNQDGFQYTAGRRSCVFLGSSGLNFPETRENTISWVIQISNYECGQNSQKDSLSSSCGTLHPDPISLQAIVFTDPNSAYSKPFHLALNIVLFQGDAQPPTHSKDRRADISFLGKEPVWKFWRYKHTTDPGEPRKPSKQICSTMNFPHPLKYLVSNLSKYC